MNTYRLNREDYARTARQAAAEGCVLLKNDGETLPLPEGRTAALFGRIQFDYYKSGLGSGGLVNTDYVAGILDALRDSGKVRLNEGVLSAYEAWLKDNPFDEGEGWGKVPWSQKEMPLTDKLVSKAAAESDRAVIIIGRTGGEDQDIRDEAGSFRLTAVEEDMIRRVTGAFERTAVVLNVGNIIDMGWVEKYHPSAVLYAWQGGQEGGNGVLDVLTGAVSPSGKLTDTIARGIADYPSTADFGDLERNYYTEDIYVGYRYFETFAPEKVLYPFGFGLSYTDFTLENTAFSCEDDFIDLTVKVTNRGSRTGKEVVQIYGEPPQGRLGKAARVLIGYGKTGEIAPGESEELVFHLPLSLLASYDDGGAAGHRSAWVLEEGSYTVLTGSDVRSARAAGSFELEGRIIEQLEAACAPVRSFSRIRPEGNGQGVYSAVREDVPLRTVKREAEPVGEIPYNPASPVTLGQVYRKEASLDDFIAGLSEEEMAALVRGEGMCSPKVTPGVAAAFGGLSPSLTAKGLPAACCADGPSGIRMDCGTKAFSLPNGTALGCTFNDALVEELFGHLGKELRLNKIDTILGPGLNIHRNPLNGRNFEYVSEDPLLTGKMAAAQLKGLARSGVTGTIKHFVANNQESVRSKADSVISERALREIYLKGFEIAVKEGGAYAVMTTYGPVNGIWTAGNYDLCTRILREEWGFEGIVMTDWWAAMNWEGEDSSRSNTAAMVKAQNDLYMCVNEAETNTAGDNTLEMLEKGVITRGELQRNCRNILEFLLRSLAMKHRMGDISPEELDDMKQDRESDFDPGDLVYYRSTDDRVMIDGSTFTTVKGTAEVFGITVEQFGFYEVVMTYSSSLGELAQLPVSLYMDNIIKGTFSLKGTEGKKKQAVIDLGMVFGANHFFKLFFSHTGLDVESLEFRLTKAVNPFEES